jgi:hypothetical protein
MVTGGGVPLSSGTIAMPESSPASPPVPAESSPQAASRAVAAESTTQARRNRMSKLLV